MFRIFKNRIYIGLSLFVLLVALYFVLYPLLVVEHTKYKYLRTNVYDSECCLALAIRYEDEESFRRERERLAFIKGLEQVKATDDGYSIHTWDGYTCYNYLPMDSIRSQYIWVLISDEDQRIVYYHKVFGFFQDDFLELFLHSL